MNNTGVQGGNGRTRTPKLKRKHQNLPSRRSKLGTWLISGASLSAFTSNSPEFFILYSYYPDGFSVSYLTRNGQRSLPDSLFSLIGLPFLFFCLVEVGYRSLLAVEEYLHLVTRYGNSIITLLSDTYHFSFSTVIGVVFAIIAFAMNSKHDKTLIYLWYEMGPTSCLTSLLGAYLLTDLLQLRSGPLYDALWIANSNGLDYGSGMAHSFFHGYLGLIIPKTGNKEKYLEELMKDYEAKNCVELIFYKLFILIPKSLYCPTSLTDLQVRTIIEESRSLDPKVQTVAGVKDRVYKNAVYKIKRENDKRIYVVAEYATPLKTFHNVLKHNGAHSYYYNKYKNEIVLRFYQTLQQVLNEHVECTNFCELIYYDDKDENGDYKDVGEVLLHRIKKLEKKKNSPERH